MPALTLPDPPLSDGVIALRGLESGDIDTLVAALQDPDIPRWTLVPSPYTHDDARDYAFGTLGLERLELRAQQGNTASQRVAVRAGFAPVAAPLVLRPECDHLPDVFFARMRR